MKLLHQIYTIESMFLQRFENNLDITSGYYNRVASVSNYINQIDNFIYYLNKINKLIIRETDNEYLGIRDWLLNFKDFGIDLLY